MPNTAKPSPIQWSICKIKHSIKAGSGLNRQRRYCMLCTGSNYAPSQSVMIIFANFSSDSSESHQRSLISYTKHFSTHHYQRAKWSNLFPVRFVGRTRCSSQTLNRGQKGEGEAMGDKMWWILLDSTHRTLSLAQIRSLLLETSLRKGNQRSFKKETRRYLKRLWTQKLKGAEQQALGQVISKHCTIRHPCNTHSLLISVKCPAFISFFAWNSGCLLSAKYTLGDGNKWCEAMWKKLKYHWEKVLLGGIFFCWINYFTWPIFVQRVFIQARQH